MKKITNKDEIFNALIEKEAAICLNAIKESISGPEVENREAIPGLDDLSLAADIFIAQCEGLTCLGRVSRDPQELVDILTDSLHRYLFGPKS